MILLVAYYSRNEDQVRYSSTLLVLIIRQQLKKAGFSHMIMENKTSSSSSNEDEILMQQSLIFSDTIKNLKILSKQLYTAAEYFEISYTKEDQKEIVVESLKDYTSKALVTAIDHLGSVAREVDSFSNEKIGVSALELHFTSLEQRLETCQEYINLAGYFQQVLMIETPKYHKQYILPEGSSAATFSGNSRSNTP